MKWVILDGLNETRNIFKKDNRRRLNGWVFNNMKSTMDAFSEALYFLHIEVMVNLDHFNNSKEL